MIPTRLIVLWWKSFFLASVSFQDAKKNYSLKKVELKKKVMKKNSSVFGWILFILPEYPIEWCKVAASIGPMGMPKPLTP